MIGADLLAWRPRIRRESDPRQGELFHDAGDSLPQGITVMPEWIVRVAPDDMRAELDARQKW